MKIRSNRWSLATPALMLGLLAFTASGVRAQAHQHAPDAPATESGCAAMMQMHTKMKADAQAADARLDALTAQMNQASGDRKVDAMTAVINEMVAQRKAMHANTHTMQTRMMGHMMEHMQKGDATMQCPMMKSMMNHSNKGGTPATQGHGNHH